MNTEVKWRCKYCETINTDDYALSNFAICEVCGHVYDWHKVITAEKQRELNKRLVSPNQEQARKC